MKGWTRESLGTSDSLERPEPAAETARTEHDLEISNHPMYASRAYSTALLLMRVRIILDNRAFNGSKACSVKRSVYDYHAKVRTSWLQLSGRCRQEALQHYMC